jgi:hypothetical protein
MSAHTYTRPTAQYTDININGRKGRWSWRRGGEMEHMSEGVNE